MVIGCRPREEALLAGSSYVSVALASDLHTMNCCPNTAREGHHLLAISRQNCAPAGMTIELNPTKAHLVVPILPGADGRRIAAIGDRVIVHKLDVAA